MGKKFNTKNLKKLTKLKKLRIVHPIHPFLFAMFPIMFFYSHNIKELRLDVVFIPLAIVISVITLSFLILNFLFKNRNKAGSLISLLILLFFSYGHVKNVMGDIHYTIGNLTIGTDKALFTSWIIILFFGIYTLIKTRQNLATLTNFLNIIAAFLVIVSVVNIAAYELKTKRLFLQFSVPNENTEQTIKNSGGKGTNPDIYYLIFDRYAGTKTLKEIYDYDNSNFYNYLNRKGFYIASESRANYPRTRLSLASSLNLKYLDYLTEELGSGSRDTTPLTSLIQNHEVGKFLKTKGYKYFHVGSWYDATRKNKYADQNFLFTKDQQLDIGEFSEKLIKTTMASPIIEKIFPNTLLGPEQNYHRNSALYQFKTVEDLVDYESPKFIFAHILLPHEPYVFDKNCNFLPNEKITRGGINNYLDQLSCTNKKIKRLVNAILSRSKKKPIIILQSDEGPFPLKHEIEKSERWEGLLNSPALEEKIGILNAYYLPGIEKGKLYSSMTPVNSFRLIFDFYFGATYNLLPDKNYIHANGGYIYKFIDVTEKLK